MKGNFTLRQRGTKVVLGVFLLAFGWVHVEPANGQTNTIQFESGTWEEIKARSGTENKPIFLDAYATWCGICKRMERNVFTDDSVAAYFNANFINAKIDMESGEGIALAKQYNVKVYPTLLFIDEQGNLVHRASGGFGSSEFLALGRAVQDPGEQQTGVTENYKADDAGASATKSNRTEIGFNVSQYQTDFGIGLHVVSPYFLRSSVAVKAGVNMQWFERSDGTETRLIDYRNIQLGLRGRKSIVTSDVSVYGEGGVFVVLPHNDFSSKQSVIGGYGLFGFEFRIFPGLAYFIELGGVGTGATADKIVGKPIYSSGFLTNVGMRIGF